MGEIISPRGWTAMSIVLVTALVVGLIGAGLDAVALVVVGGAAAVLATTAGRRPEPAVDADPPLPEPEARAPILEAIADPLLILTGSRVAAANGAALALLGTHIVGEDTRTVIRHPAATAALAGDGGDGSVELVGLGTADQRWEMRVASLDEGRRLIHLVDRSGSHAAERMRVDFVANASHELRTPLASILGYVETLSDAAGEDPAIRARFLRIVFDEARRMERLVDDLMSLSRIEAEKFRAPSEAIDFAALVDETRDALADGHDGRGRDIVLEHDARPIPVLGDRVQLSQLLHNLIGNAMKYGRAGTPIRVSLTDGGDVVRLVVADEGEGIAAEHIPRLTERFYRVDPGRSRSVGGTGLGLAIVKHIVERHRGRFDITSRPNDGTRVTVTLRTPAAPTRAAAAVTVINR